MSRRKRSAPADLGDDSEEDEPITQTLRKYVTYKSNSRTTASAWKTQVPRSMVFPFRRGGRQVSEEAQEDDAEHDDIGTEEEEAGPSKRSRKSRRQNRNLKSQEVAEGNILEETAAKTKKKSKPKGDRPSKRTNAGEILQSVIYDMQIVCLEIDLAYLTIHSCCAVEDAQVAGSGESGDDDDIEALEQRVITLHQCAVYPDTEKHIIHSPRSC